MAVAHRIRTLARKSPLLYRALQSVHAFFMRRLYDISPVLLARYRFRRVRGRSLDLNRPRTFDEKLLWLMLYWRHPLKTRCGDKYAMRDYVEEKGWGKLLPRVLGLYEKSSEIDFAALPERFVLKCTHGCKFNIICTDKSALDLDRTRRQLEAWLKVDYCRVYGEVHYAGMHPRILCEEFLADQSGGLPSDYKLYCFDGVVHCTLVCRERGLDGDGAKYRFYDREWKATLPYLPVAGSPPSRDVPRPEGYEEMIRSAEELARPFPFVRLDYFNIAGRVLLGEMTFTPATCIDTGYSDLGQHDLGELLTLPEKRME